jgi:hypothetical protein
MAELLQQLALIFCYLLRYVRGRQYQNDFLEAGTADVVLNNQSGAFDPSNTSSPWYGILIAGMQSKNPR